MSDTRLYNAVSFDVFEHPRPGGSKRGIIHRMTGKVVMIDASKNREWRSAVKAAAVEAMGTMAPLCGPLRLDVAFFMPRPKHHLTGKGFRSSTWKPFPDQAPDPDKLLRSTQDAMSGIAYNDDSQVVFLCAAKYYASELHRVGARIEINEMQE